MKQKETIIIKKSNGLFRAKLVAPENGETVGTTKGYSDLKYLLDDLVQAREDEEYEVYKDKGGKHRFRFTYAHHFTLILQKVIRSEPYASRQKAEQGIQACKRCLEIGLCALEFSKDSGIYSLDALAANPGLGIVNT